MATLSYQLKFQLHHSAINIFLQISASPVTDFLKVLSNNISYVTVSPLICPSTRLSTVINPNDD